MEKDSSFSFFDNRRGADSISVVLTVLGIAGLAIRQFYAIGWLIWPSLIVLVVAFLRMSTKEHKMSDAEKQELDEFWAGLTEKSFKNLSLKDGLNYSLKEKLKFKKADNTKADNTKADKTKVIVTCPVCSKKLRVDKGKGAISITCPSCHHSFKSVV